MRSYWSKILIHIWSASILLPMHRMMTHFFSFLFYSHFARKYVTWMANVRLWFSHFASVNAAKSGPQHKAWINRWEACSGGQGEEVLCKHRSGLDKCLRPVTPTQPHSPTTQSWEELGKKETILSIFCRQIPLSKQGRRSTQGLIHIV